MKSTYLALGALMSIWLPGCMTSEHAPADEAAISRVLEEWNLGWQTKDAELAAHAYSREAAFTNAFGFHRFGRREITDYIAEVFTLDFVMTGTSTDEVVDIRFLDDDIALVRTRRTRTGQTMPDGTPMSPREITHLRVFQRHDGEWLIESHLISDARDTQRPRH